MKKVAHFQKTTSFITAQDIVHVLILITLSLLLILIPVRGFGQTTPEPPENGGFPALDSVFDSEIPKVPTPSTEPAPTADLSSPAEFPPPAAAPIAPQTPKTFDPASETPTIDQFQDAAPSNAAPLDTAALNPPPQEAPLPSEATPMPPTARQFSTVQVAPLRQPIQQNTRLDTIISSEHPFRQYWGMPNDPQTIITGKPMTVAELFTGTRSAAVRCQLLQAYWELSGLLAVYHFRGETERQAGSAVGTQQTDLITLLNRLDYVTSRTTPHCRSRICQAAVGTSGTVETVQRACFIGIGIADPFGFSVVSALPNARR